MTDETIKSIQQFIHNWTEESQDEVFDMVTTTDLKLWIDKAVKLLKQVLENN